MMNRAADFPDPAPSWLSCGGDYVAVRVVTRPGSTRRGIIRQEPRGLVIGVNAPPEKGRANAELAELFAAMLRAQIGRHNRAWRNRARQNHPNCHPCARRDRVRIIGRGGAGLSMDAHADIRPLRPSRVDKGALHDYVPLKERFRSSVG